MNIEYKGKTLTLMQDAFLAGGEMDNEHYEAQAKDENGNEYTIFWEITAENFEDLQDESDACDWDVFTVSPEIYTTAEILKDEILSNCDNRDAAIQICKSNAEFKAQDLTEGSDDSYTDIFEFNDGSALKIGSDDSVFIEEEYTISYLSVGE
jgi:hypothetical protein